jgi:hypothetical protein
MSLYDETLRPNIVGPRLSNLSLVHQHLVVVADDDDDKFCLRSVRVTIGEAGANTTLVASVSSCKDSSGGYVPQIYHTLLIGALGV